MVKHTVRLLEIEKGMQHCHLKLYTVSYIIYNHIKTFSFIQFLQCRKFLFSKRVEYLSSQNSLKLPSDRISGRIIKL